MHFLPMTCYFRISNINCIFLFFYVAYNLNYKFLERLFFSVCFKSLVVCKILKTCLAKLKNLSQ